jgi:hypothetical protein
MISWGVQVNDYGNAILDADGNFSKVKGEGVTEEMWAEMAPVEAKEEITKPQPPLRISCSLSKEILFECRKP